LKKNNRTYLLLAVVIGIWGIIGFKIIKASNPYPKLVVQMTSNEIFEPKQVKKRDTFSIAANYRDPFLGTVHAPKKMRKTTSKVVKKQVPDKVISYTGFITDKASKQKVFFVTIEGQQQMMGLNDTFKDVKLIRGTKDKIKVRYNGKTQNIAIKQ